jgi:putative transposase
MPLESIKGRSSWQKFQRGEVAAVIVPFMGRFNRVVALDVPHHITQRGNGRSFILDCDADRAVYLKLLHENLDLYEVGLIGYCLMSNHVRLIAIPAKAEGLAEALKQTHGRYACYWNVAHQSSGHVWQGRYYSCPLDQTHLWEALRYTELNPLRARLVPEPELWPWSSAAIHCGTNEQDTFLTLDAWRRHWTVTTWREYLGEGEKGKWNPSWPSFVNAHTRGDHWELQSSFRILRRPRDGTWHYKSAGPARRSSQIKGSANSPSTRNKMRLQSTSPV